MKKLFNLILCVMITSFGVFSQEKIVLYPKGVEESNGISEKESFTKDGTFLVNVSEARMYSYVVPASKANGVAVLICPGGGYGGLSTVYEGEKIARWFNELGVSAFVLYYRMPNTHYQIPLKDAQTAMKLIRENSKKWNIDKNKVGVIGFSAGGHLASTLGTHSGCKTRPNFMALIYPVITMKEDTTHSGTFLNLLGKNPSEKLIGKYSNELQVSRKTPPTFLIHSKDDNVVPIKNSELFYNALREKNVPAEIHIYENGGHGYSMKPSGVDSDHWTDALKLWLKNQKFVE